MVTIDLFNKIKNKIELRLRRKAFRMSYKEFCKEQKSLKIEEAFEDKTLEKIVKKDVYVTEE